jgi:hypothetical protein
MISRCSKPLAALALCRGKSTHAHGWHQARCFFPERDRYSLTLDFPDTNPLLLTGPHAALLAVYATWHILDGKVFDTDRVAGKKLNKKAEPVDTWYAGKTHDFGGNVQALMTPKGIPLWLSDVLPGGVHDLTAARRFVLAAVQPYLCDMPILADPGYQGAGHGILTPVKKPKDGSELDVNTRTYNSLLRAIRALGERGFALLVQRWKTLQHITMSPNRIGKLARAALVLVHFEHKIIS